MSPGAANGRTAPSRRPRAPGRGCTPGTRAAPGAALAALDLGTNNCRLLVARAEGDDFVVLDAFSRAVRLGEGVERTRTLDAAAQERAIRALRICAAKMRRHRVREARLVATEACRRAANGREFLRRVSRETGLRMEIISPEEEARLAVAGCAPLVDASAEQLLVFDIGGGSTELVWIDLSRTPPGLRRKLVRALAPPRRRAAESATARAAAAHIVDWVSVPVGVSTLCERFSDISSPAARVAAMAECFEAHLACFAPYRARRRDAFSDRLQIIGVSGTPTTFGAIHLGLESYDRRRVDGLWLPRAAAFAIAERLMQRSDRAPPGGGAAADAISPRPATQRRSLLLSGAAILLSILRLWPAERMRVADRGLREGLLYAMIEAAAEPEA